jgi:phosphoribosyl-AMP cyclohydrolase
VNIPKEISAHFAAGTLIAAIAQDFSSKEVLMVAWMNQEALEQTLLTGNVTYWSRSRNQLWVKGESSGHTQRLISIRYDCDGDALLLEVDQSGAACHTGERSCFYREIGMDA